MAPVLIKHVVRFSSQNSLTGKVDNLLKSQTDPSAGRWTCSHEECGEKLEGEFQLERASTISHVDIGNYGSAFVEVLVGNSMWPIGKDFLSLVPSAMLMTPSDSKQWIQIKSVRMFHGESLNKSAMNEKWDRIKVICRQPYRKDKPFGLSFVRIGAPDDNKTTTSYSLVKSPTNQSIPVLPQSRKEKKEVGVNKITPPGLTSCLRQLKSSPENQTGLNRGSKMLQAALDKPKTPKSSLTIKRSPTWMDEEDNGDGTDILEIQSMYTWKGINNDWQIKDVSPNARKKELKEKTKSPEMPEKKWSLNGDIEDEIDCFLGGIDFTEVDLETVTYSDLRALMESQRGCSLTKSEKKMFIKKAKEVVGRVMEQKENASSASIIGEEFETCTPPSKTLARNLSPSTSKESRNSNPATLSPSTVSTKESPPATSLPVEDLDTKQLTKSKTKRPRGKNTSPIATPINKTPSTKAGKISPRIRRTSGGTPSKTPSTKAGKISPRIRPTSGTPRSSLENITARNKGEAQGTTSHITVDSDDELPSCVSYEPPEKKRHNSISAEKSASLGKLNRDSSGKSASSCRREVSVAFGSSNTKVERIVESDEESDELPSYFSYDKESADNSSPSTSTGQNSVFSSTSKLHVGQPDSTTYNGMQNISKNTPGIKRNSDKESDNTGLPSKSKHMQALSRPSKEVEEVECPICGKSFPVSIVEGHAARCTDFAPDSPPKHGACAFPHKEDLVDCPICTARLPLDQIQEHANQCAERTMTSQAETPVNTKISHLNTFKEGVLVVCPRKLNRDSSGKSASSCRREVSVAFGSSNTKVERIVESDEESDELPSYFSYDKESADNSSPSTSTGQNSVFSSTSKLHVGQPDSTTYNGMQNISKNTPGFKRNSDKESDNTGLPSKSKHMQALSRPSKEVEEVECPICGKSFPVSIVEGHAARCTDFAPDSPPKHGACAFPHKEDLVDCPICTARLPLDQIQEHANQCAERTMTSQAGSHVDSRETVILA